jgi:hypothetical protein
MSEYEALRKDLDGIASSMSRYAAAVAVYTEVATDEIKALWKDNAELRDELHALANRVETLTRARLTEPTEVAEAVVKRMHEVRLRPRGLGDGSVAVCNCGWRSEEMATESAALAHGHYHVQEVTQ